MDSKRALAWSGRYFLVTTVFALVGLLIAAGGLGLGGLQGFQAYQSTGSVVAAARAVGPALLALPVGVAIWRLGKAWAFYRYLTGAMEEQLADTFDTQHVKSDIVSVLDDRLHDMQQDLQSTNRELRKLKDEDQFTFEDSTVSDD